MLVLGTLIFAHHILSLSSCHFGVGVSCILGSAISIMRPFMKIAFVLKNLIEMLYSGYRTAYCIHFHL